MAAHVLVVATVTATSDDLMAALDERVRTSAVPVDFTQMMPAAGTDVPPGPIARTPRCMSRPPRYARASCERPSGACSPR